MLEKKRRGVEWLSKVIYQSILLPPSPTTSPKFQVTLTLTIKMAKSTITLASGKEMPLVGFGLWKVPKETAADTVYNVSIPFIPIWNKS